MTPIELIRQRRLLPAVACLENPEDAVCLAKSLLAGGLDVMEITLRHPRSLECIAAIAKQVPAMCCGAGTILRPEQIDQVIEAGAKFGVTPGFNPQTTAAAVQRKFPFIPGVASPGELEQALGLGCELVKFFPSEALGGTAYLNAISAPYRHTGVGVVPMGGIHADNLEEYLAVPIVAAVGFSALTPTDDVKNGRWNDISKTISDILKSIAP